MSDPAFTILLPVHRPPAMLPYAITSVLAQNRRDFELFVICDGAPPDTASCAQEFAAKDPRIRVFVHPKGEGHGDAYRHQALQEAHGMYVCQIGDDDLWFPNHLDEMALLLRDVDFGNLSHFEVLADGRVVLLSGDAADPVIRQRMLRENFNFFGPTVWGYRLSAYRSLPVGWSPAPPGFPSDLHMIRKFFGLDELRFGTRVAVTAMKCAAHFRRDWSLDRRAAEVASWAARVADPSGRDAIIQMGLGEMNRRSYAQQVEYPSLLAQALRTQAEELRATLAAQTAALASAKDGNSLLRRQLRARSDQIRKLRHRIKAMRTSWTWRLTRPFRRLARLIGR